MSYLLRLSACLIVLLSFNARALVITFDEIPNGISISGAMVQMEGYIYDENHFATSSINFTFQ